MAPAPVEPTVRAEVERIAGALLTMAGDRTKSAVNAGGFEFDFSVEHARALARGRKLEAADVADLLHLRIGTYGDFEFSEKGFKRRSVTQRDFEQLTDDEQRTLLKAGPSFRLRFPCTPRQLAVWAETNGYDTRLPVAFLDELGRRSQLGRRRGAPKKITDEWKRSVEGAARKLLTGIRVGELRTWTAPRVACHADFLRNAWPSRYNTTQRPNHDDPQLNRKYRENYGVNLRAVLDVIAPVLKNFKQGREGAGNP